MKLSSSIPPSPLRLSQSSFPGFVQCGGCVPAQGSSTVGMSFGAGGHRLYPAAVLFRRQCWRPLSAWERSSRARGRGGGACGRSLVSALRKFRHVTPWSEVGWHGFSNARQVSLRVNAPTSGPREGADLRCCTYSWLRLDRLLTSVHTGRLRIPALVRGAAAASPGVVSAHKPKDMYSDLARYGIIDEFDMAPMPFYVATSAPTVPSLPPAPSKPQPGRPKRRIGRSPGSDGSVENVGEEVGTGLKSDLRRTATRGVSVPADASGRGALEERTTSGITGSKGTAQPRDEAGPGAWSVYLLLAADHKKTYVGVTNDVERRVKQHNGEIVGGAKTTKAGRPWSLLCSVSGFHTRSEAFQFEWRWKNPRAIKGDGSFDRNSMAPSAQILRMSEAAAAAAASVGATTTPLVVERRRAALEDALTTFPKWRYLQVDWADGFRW